MQTHPPPPLLSLFIVLPLLFADLVDILREHAHFYDFSINREADFVDILREHAHFDDFPIIRESSFCRYLTCAR